MATGLPFLVRLSGRCTDGAQRDAGRRIHVVLSETGWAPAWGRALCGAKPGRHSGCGFVEVDGAEAPTCPRCAAAADRLIRAVVR